MAEKVVYTVPEFLIAFSLGRTKFYEAVNSGALRVRKHGHRTLVTAADAQAWLDSLPVVAPKQAA